MPGTISLSQWGTMVVSGLLLWSDLNYRRDGGFTTYGPPRYRPDLLKKQRAENPPPNIKNLSQRFNKIPGHNALLCIDYENLDLLHGIK